MTHRLPNLAALCLAALIAACGESGPPLTVTDVLAVAPLPGQESAAAYLTLHNHSREPVTIHRVSSPDFTRVEMHENLIVDGV
ncbi:MAG: copper chaperone PCu(A)C, partial [Woeseiaceae bacterium]